MSFNCFCVKFRNIVIFELAGLFHGMEVLSKNF